MHKLIEQKRKEKKIKVDDLCKKIGISKSTYYNIIYKRTKLSEQPFFKLLKELDINEITKNMLKNI